MLLSSTGLLVSLIGFFVSHHIQRKVHAKKPLMCPRSAPCEAVVTSTHATTFGIRNTLLGQLYYLCTAGLFVVLLNGLSLPFWLLFVVTLVGFLFSLYLVYIQAFVLRKWCVWCLVSAAAAMALFTIVCLR